MPTFYLNQCCQCTNLILEKHIDTHNGVCTECKEFEEDIQKSYILEERRRIKESLKLLD